MILLCLLSFFVSQGRGQDSEQSWRMAGLLGGLCPNITSLQLDWCGISGQLIASLQVWLPHLRKLSLVSANTADVKGNWPTSIVTWSDIAQLTNLTHLEVIDSHLPFLEMGVQDITPLSALTKLETLHLVFTEFEHPWPGSKPCYLLMGVGEVSRACKQLKELVLDGVHLAKVISPNWPSLTSVCIGFISGWHPSLVTALQLHAAAPRLKHLSLGHIK